MLDCRSIHQLLNLASAFLKVAIYRFPIHPISHHGQIVKGLPPLHYLLFILRTISYFLPLFRRFSLPTPSGCCLSLAGGRGCGCRAKWRAKWAATLCWKALSAWAPNSSSFSRYPTKVKKYCIRRGAALCPPIFNLGTHKGCPYGF